MKSALCSPRPVARSGASLTLFVARVGVADQGAGEQALHVPAPAVVGAGRVPRVAVAGCDSRFSVPPVLSDLLTKPMTAALNAALCGRWCCCWIVVCAAAAVGSRRLPRQRHHRGGGSVSRPPSLDLIEHWFPLTRARRVGSRCRPVGPARPGRCCGRARARPADAGRRGRAGHRVDLGSRASRRPSPNRLNASTVMNSARPGQNRSIGSFWT